MRRLLVIAMMLLLPFQSTWAVAASVCAHETGKASHFGHHEHQHQAAGAAAHGDGGDGAQTGGYHADCGVCHGVGTAVFGADAGASDSWTDREFTMFYRAHLADPPVEAFLRPPLLHVS